MKIRIVRTYEDAQEFDVPADITEEQFVEWSNKKYDDLQEQNNTPVWVFTTCVDANTEEELWDI